MSNNPAPKSGELIDGTDVRAGVFMKRDNTLKRVVYSAVDGNAVFEGDIVLGTVEQMQRAVDAIIKAQGTEALEGVVIAGTGLRWPNKTVAYLIDPSLTNPIRVRQAIQHWEQETEIRFRQRTDEADYVVFRPGDGCSSSVGRQGGQQSVNLGDNCTAGNVIHEIGHTIGLWHEQSREDRDNFITILWANIIASTKHNFDQHIVDGDDVGGYDYGSIMHYPADAFAINPNQPTIITPHGEAIGQRTGLSAGDKAAVKVIYP